MASAEVGIVGAGVHGAAAAFHLASRGVHVTILERERPASGPTGRSSAICRAYYTNPFLAAVARDSIAVMAAFDEHTGRSAEFRRTGLLFSPGSVSSLVSVVETLLNEQALRADLVREGRAWVESHRTWDLTTAVYRNVYARARSRAASRGADSWKRQQSNEAAEAR